MKPKRVECSDCSNFIPAIFSSFFSFNIAKSAKCKLGKRVMFRKPTFPGMNDENAGYFRYCNDFEKK